MVLFATFVYIMFKQIFTVYFFQARCFYVGEPYYFTYHKPNFGFSFQAELFFLPQTELLF
jgi:hypothetical protein